jgi:hypothetical protein
MSTLTITSEKTFADLQATLGSSGAAATGLLGSFQAANPGVNLNQLNPGMVLNLPTQSVATATVPGQKLPASLVGNFSALLQSNVAAISTRLSQQVATRTAQINSVVAALDPAALKALSASAPDLAASLATTLTAMKAEAAANQASIANLATVQQQVAADWATLAQKIPGLAGATQAPASG